MILVPLKLYVNYVRVSSDDQVREETPEGQRLELRRLSERMPGEHAGTYEDLGVSGISVRLVDRPGWQALKRRLAQGGVSEIRVADPTRFTREVGFQDLNELHVTMRQYGVAVVLADGQRFTHENWTMLAMLTLQLLQGGAQAGILRQSFDRGKRAKLLEGHPVGGPPKLGFGWTRERGWSHNPTWAPVIHRAFILSAEGLSLSRVSDSLEAEGLHPPSAKRWNESFLRKILRDPMYKGDLRQTYKGEEFATSVPPIVTAELWDAVQIGLTARRHLPVRADDVAFLCRHLLVCGSCDARLWAQPAWGASPGRYYCPKCRGSGAPYWRRNQVDEAVWAAVRDALGNADALLDSVAREADGDESAGMHEDALRAARDDLAQIDRRRVVVRNRYLNGRMTEEEADADLEILAERKRTAEARVNGAERALRSAMEMSVHRSKAASRLQELRARIEGADAATRRELLLALVPLGTGSIRLDLSGRIELRGVLAPVVKEGTVSPAP